MQQVFIIFGIKQMDDLSNVLMSVGLCHENVQFYYIIILDILRGDKQIFLSCDIMYLK